MTAATPFTFSNVLGAATAGSISNIYYPMADRGAGLTGSRAAIALGNGCLGNLFHKHGSEAHPSEPSGWADEIDSRYRNRCEAKGERFTRVGCPSTCCTSDSPSAAECLNPCPEHAEANTTFSESRNLSMMNFASGVTV